MIVSNNFFPNVLHIGRFPRTFLEMKRSIFSLHLEWSVLRRIHYIPVVLLLSPSLFYIQRAVVSKCFAKLMHNFPRTKSLPFLPRIPSIKATTFRRITFIFRQEQVTTLGNFRRRIRAISVCDLFRTVKSHFSVINYRIACPPGLCFGRGLKLFRKMSTGVVKLPIRKLHSLVTLVGHSEICRRNKNAKRRKAFRVH